MDNGQSYNDNRDHSRERYESIVRLADRIAINDKLYEQYKRDWMLRISSCKEFTDSITHFHPFPMACAIKHNIDNISMLKFIFNTN